MMSYSGNIGLFADVVITPNSPNTPERQIYRPWDDSLGKCGSKDSAQVLIDCHTEDYGDSAQGGRDS